jgi:outer membrane protein
MMEFAQKKNVKVISLAIAALMVIGVFVLAIQGRNLGGGDATTNSAIGKVNYNQVMASAPGLADAQTQLQQAAEDSRKEFEEKSKDMSDADKQKLAQEYQKKGMDHGQMALYAADGAAAPHWLQLHPWKIPFPETGSAPVCRGGLG